MLRSLYYLEDEVRDTVADSLKDRGWSVGEACVEGGWVAFACKEGLQFCGQGARQNIAWRDLLQKLKMAGKFGRHLVVS
jgi:hypothetical protein